MDLSACGLTSLNAESLAEALTSNKHLEELNICSNAVCDDGVHYIAHALRINQGLKKLYLRGCFLTSLSTKSLAEALTTNKHLEELNISSNPLCDDGIQHLAHALRVNHHLKRLDLGNCGFTDVALECLSNSIRDNKSLNTLNVVNLADRNKNLITEKIVPVLIECLQNNHTLTMLYLPDNLESYTTGIQKAVNDVRKRNGLPLIQVHDLFSFLNEL